MKWLVTKSNVSGREISCASASPEVRQRRKGKKVGWKVDGGIKPPF
jgi:hypothetical protein